MKDANGFARVPEVCIYFSGHLIRGNRSTKINADGFNAFESFNYPHLCDAGVNFAFHDHHILKPDFSKPMIPHLFMNPNVLIFSLFPGIQEHVISHVLTSKEVRGIVMRTFGSGNAPHEAWLMRILKEATNRGIVVVNISQCVSGSVQMNRYDTGSQLKQNGLVSGFDSTVEAAVTKLMFLTARFKDANVIRSQMSRSLAGEITIDIEIGRASCRERV